MLYYYYMCTALVPAWGDDARGWFDSGMSFRTYIRVHTVYTRVYIIFVRVYTIRAIPHIQYFLCAAYPREPELIPRP